MQSKGQITKILNHLKIQIIHKILTKMMNLIDTKLKRRFQIFHHILNQTIDFNSTLILDKMKIEHILTNLFWISVIYINIINKHI